jgi:hypothetical protein
MTAIRRAGELLLLKPEATPNSDLLDPASTQSALQIKQPTRAKPRAVERKAQMEAFLKLLAKG